MRLSVIVSVACAVACVVCWHAVSGISVNELNKIKSHLRERRLTRQTESQRLNRRDLFKSLGVPSKSSIAKSKKNPLSHDADDDDNTAKEHQGDPFKSFGIPNPKKAPNDPFSSFGIPPAKPSGPVDHFASLGIPNPKKKQPASNPPMSISSFDNIWTRTDSPYTDPSTDEIFESELDISQIDQIRVPKDILAKHPHVTSVSLSYNKIKSIRKNDFPWMNSTYIIKLDGNYIDYIAPDAFEHIPNLLEIDLSNNMLRDVPRALRTNGFESQLTTMNLQHNQITDLRPEDLENYPMLEHFDVQDNKIQVIYDKSFKNNKFLEKLVFNDNPLKEIQPNALVGPLSLKTLYFKNTDIVSLPSNGIEHLTKLDLRNAHNLLTIPDPSRFRSLKEVKVLYQFHCCAFQAERKRRKLNNTRSCNPEELKKNSDRQLRKRDENVTVKFDPFSQIAQMLKTQPPTEPIEEAACTPMKMRLAEMMLKFNKGLEIKCTPVPDAFNPCDNVMGSDPLRVCSWIVAIFAIIGNIFQLVILFHNRQELTVYKLLMYNLGISNLMMGIYLIVLCCVDAYTFGEFYNYAISWQLRGGCKAFGFIAVFATQLSLCSLVLITIERYLLIIFALQAQYQMKLRQAKMAVALSWIYSLIIAALPATDFVSSYTKTAICLPFSTNDSVSTGYVMWLTIAYVLAFIQIVYCYVSMYHSISDIRNPSATSTIDYQVAKRMSLIIFSNFVCWLPISVAGMLALYSQSAVFDVGVAKFLLVFIFPLNACTNPFLYAIFTKVFRGDILRLLSSCGMCKDAEREFERRNNPQHGSIRRAKKRSETTVSFKTHFEYNQDTYARNRARDMKTVHENENSESEFQSPESVRNGKCSPRCQEGAILDSHSPPKVAYACINLKQSELSATSVTHSDGRVKKPSARLVVDERRHRTESNATCSTDPSYGNDAHHLRATDDLDEHHYITDAGYASRNSSGSSTGSPPPEALPLYTRQNTTGSRQSTESAESSSLLR